MKNNSPIAILYQAGIAPKRNGIQKPMKEGGYSDSGADIAFCLKSQGIPLITPKANPDIKKDTDWVFPDTIEGIQSAIDKGAKTLWLNTVLYKGHAIEKFYNKKIAIVGQLAEEVDLFDDKWMTNALLKKNGLPIPASILVSAESIKELKVPFPFPYVVKPIRGRGSQGVSLVYSKNDLLEVLSRLFAEGKYGTKIYLEEFLPGEEITFTLMPPGSYLFDGIYIQKIRHWSLPAVRRFNHVKGIAPYSGLVAVAKNSCTLDAEEGKEENIQKAMADCTLAATLVKARAPIRIDCRADSQGTYFLFDLNMKPNMTGASRPHRKGQNSLSLIAAEKIGWTYADFLKNIINQPWHF